MKVSDIPVVVLEQNRIDGTLLPFIKGRRVIGENMMTYVPVWLQLIPPEPVDIQYGDEWNRRLILAAAWQKPLANQTLADYDQLEILPCGVRKANMVGVYELLKQGLPEGDDGDVFFVSPKSLNAWKVDNFIGVWADSKGAAKRFLERVTKQFDCESRFKEFGLDPKLVYDWRTF